VFVAAKMAADQGDQSTPISRVIQADINLSNFGMYIGKGRRMGAALLANGKLQQNIIPLLRPPLLDHEIQLTVVIHAWYVR
jgi:hypothetical protein